MSDPTQAGLSRTVEQGERVVDAMFSRLARESAAIIRDVCGSGPVLQQHYPAIMRRIDQALLKIYPETPGAPSTLEDAVAAMSNVGRLRGLKAGVAPIAETVARDPELAREIREQAKPLLER